MTGTRAANGRSLITALAVVSALALAACSGSTGGSPQVAGSGGATSAEQAASSSAGVAPSSAGAAPSSAAAAPSSAAAPASSTGAVPSSAAAVASSAGGASSGAAAASSEAAGGEESSADESKVTIGSGGLDSTTAHWFDVFCTGLAPMGNMDTTLSNIDPSHPAAMQKSYVDFFNTLGDAFINTAGKLQSTPPPTFAQGPTVASDLIKELTTVGPEMKAIATAVGAADGSDAQAIETAIATASEKINTDMSGLDINKYELDSKTEAAVEAIPSCKAIGFSTTG